MTTAAAATAAAAADDGRPPGCGDGGGGGDAGDGSGSRDGGDTDPDERVDVRRASRARARRARAAARAAAAGDGIPAASSLARRSRAATPPNATSPSVRSGSSRKRRSATTARSATPPPSALADARAGVAGQRHRRSSALAVAADLARSRQYESARRVYRRGVADTPADGRLWLGWARMEARAPAAAGGGRLAARSVYAAALEVLPDNAFLLHAAGVFESSAGRYSRARELLARAAVAAPTDGLVYQAAALVEERAGATARARELFATGASRDPGNAHLLSAWGAMEARSGRPAAAAALYERAVNADPGHSRSWQGWAVAAARTGQSDKAASLFARAVELAPDSAPTLQAWGLAEADRGDVDRARELFKAALDAGGGVATYHAWGRLEEGLGNYARARELYDAGVRDDPAGVACLSAWAIMEAKLGHISKDAEWMVPRPDEGNMARKRRNERLRAEREGLKILKGAASGGTGATTSARDSGRQQVATGATAQQVGKTAGEPLVGTPSTGLQHAHPGHTRQRLTTGTGGGPTSDEAHLSHGADQHHDVRAHRHHHQHHAGAAGSDASGLILPVTDAAAAAGVDSNSAPLAQAASTTLGARHTASGHEPVADEAHTRVPPVSDNTAETFEPPSPASTARPTAAPASAVGEESVAAAARPPPVTGSTDDRVKQLSTISTNLRMLKRLVGQRTDEDTRTLLTWLNSRAQADASLFTRLAARGEADSQKLMQWAARRSANDVRAFSDWVARRYEEDRRIGVYVFGLDIPRSARTPAADEAAAAAAAASSVTVVEKPVEWLTLTEPPPGMSLAEFDEHLYTSAEEAATREVVWVMVWLGRLAESLANRAALTTALAGMSVLVVAASLHLMTVTGVPDRPVGNAVKPAEGVDAQLIQQQFD